MDDDVKNAVLGVLLAIVCIGVIGTCSVCTGIVNFGANQANKVINRTVEVDTAFNNYEWFHTQYNDILASQAKIESAYSMSVQKNLSEDMKSMYQINYSGQVNFIQSMVSEYNSKSDMWNRTLFKDKKLPYKIHAKIDDGKCILTYPDE